VETETATARRLDAAPLQARLDTGAFDPFGPLPADLTLLGDRARSVNQSGSAEFVVNGSPSTSPPVRSPPQSSSG
jgi:hypothetical protein